MNTYNTRCTESRRSVMQAIREEFLVVLSNLAWTGA
jgi:hypothetical protein